MLRNVDHEGVGMRKGLCAVVGGDLRLLLSAMLAEVVLAADFATGPFVQFPLLFLIPIAYAAWRSGWIWGMGLAVFLSLMRALFVPLWGVPWTMSDTVVNTTIRIATFCLFALLIDRASQQTKELRREVRTLRGLLSICSFCKRIRIDGDKWEQIETYVSERSEARFSHGVCPECVREHYADLVDEPTPRAADPSTMFDMLRRRKGDRK